MHPIAIKLIVDVENKVNQIVETVETLGNIFHICTYPLTAYGCNALLETSMTLEIH